MITLQFRWSDEPDRWRDMRALDKGETPEEALKQARENAAAAERRYPHHKFTAEFRVI